MVFGIFCAFGAHAGFGITPPYVKNQSLTRNSRYEQKIILVRSDPIEDLEADITLNVPEANEWISVDRGTKFLMPKGEKQVPIIVTVTVPGKANFANYKGNMRIKVSPPRGPEVGTVGIALGAQVDVDFTVIDKEIIDFKIQRIAVNDLNEGHKWLWMFFPGKIIFTMQLENTGNVAAAPSKVLMDLYDRKQEHLLESTKNTNTLQKIEPFQTGNVVAELPVKLKAGSYKVNYRIYKQDLIAQEGILDIAILPWGTIPSDKGYGILGLAVGDQLILLAMLMGVISPVAFFIGHGRRKKKARRR